MIDTNMFVSEILPGGKSISKMAPFTQWNRGLLMK